MNIIVNGEEVGMITKVIFIAITFVPWVYGVGKFLSFLIDKAFDLMERTFF